MPRSDTVLALVYEKELVIRNFLEEVKQQDCRLGGWTAFLSSGMVEQLCEPAVEIAVPALRDD